MCRYGDALVCARRRFLLVRRLGNRESESRGVLPRCESLPTPTVRLKGSSHVPEESSFGRVVLCGVSNADRRRQDHPVSGWVIHRVARG
jgi:hypothetical protein